MRRLAHNAVVLAVLAIVAGTVLATTASSDAQTTAVAANPSASPVRMVIAAIERRAINDPHINADQPKPQANPTPATTTAPSTPTSRKPSTRHSTAGSNSDAQRANRPPINPPPTGQQDPPGDTEFPPPGQVPCNPGCGPVLHPTPIPPPTP